MAPWPGGPGRDATDDDADADEDATIDDDEEEYEEAEGENRLLGFMFGNVDDAGDLDVDYLDEDAKEHLAALANKLGSSLKDIDLSTKSPQTQSDAINQDYHAKAENAVDYEDIDEEYEGPEIDNVTEEDLLLSKKEFTSKVVSITSLENTLVLDDENYDDEDDDLEKQSMATGDHIEVQPLSPSSFGKPNDIHEALPQEGSLTDDVHAFEIENRHKVNPEQDVSSPSEELADGVAPSVLPVLFVDNGNAILRFSEVFCIHETSKKARKRECQYMIHRDKYMSMDACDIVEEDDELFLKAPSADLSRMRQFQRKLNAFDLGFQDDPVKSGHVRKLDKMSLGVDDYKNGSCISSEPMKDGILATSFPGWNTPLSPQFHPLNQEDWEERIVWDDSASSTDSFVESCELSGPDSDTLAVKDIDLESETEVLDSEIHHKPLDKANLSNVYNYVCTVEPFDLEVVSQPSGPTISRSHPQLLRLESQLDKPAANVHGTKFFSDAITRFSMLTLQNRDVVEGSWLDNITWEEQHKSVVKPKLILDLQDQKMLFELSDMVDAKHLLLHSGAMIISRSLQHSSTGDPVEQHSHGCFTSGRFNISNDKFYSNRKSSQQLRSHSKKRTIQGLKVLHSVPALKLQTMKTKLSNKDIANFHRPKALWYPHDIEVPFKEHGRSARQGAMKIILKSLGSKGSKLHVDAEETISSVKAKASKKLDLKLSEPVKIFYSGRELEENKSLTEHDVQPNSVLHLIRTSIHQLPRAQKLPGENKSLRPPGAFKKKSDLSVKDGRVYLMEYCEERPLLLSNAGMGARLCTYYQKSAPADQTGNVLRNENSGLGSIITLDPADKSPFLGDIRPGSSQSCLETNMYRAPIFQHKVPSTDYLLVRSSKGKLSIRRIDRIDVVGQQEPHIEAMSPGSKGVQFYIMNRLLVYMYREFRASEKRGLNPSVRADELLSQFPSLSDVFLRKRLKNCADLQKGSNGHYHWVMKRNFRIPSEEELRRMVTPENVCAYESMQAGMYRLKRLGITKLTHPIGISSAMNQLPDEAIALAAASHIERELQITPWNLSSNFVACTNQDRENIERLEITGVGDPSGRGLGFSYVRATPKAPISNATLKKKTFVGKGSTVTGTDADLRRLSMEAARELLLKFNVPEEQIAKLTRWHRIAQIRKLSSEQAASGVKVDPTTVSKFARGQRMSFLQLQQQAREKCQEIWDRQVQSLCSVDAEENESESDANSDLDSFAGDLENLLDAEECEEGEEGNEDGKHENFDGVKGLKMRRRPLQTQAEEEIEDEAAEAAELCRILMDDDDADWRKKKKTKAMAYQIGSSLRSHENAQGMKKSGSVSKRLVQPVGSIVLTEKITKDQMEVESLSAQKHFIGKLKPKKQNEIDQMGLLNKKIKILGDGMTVIKEKKSARDSFVCGACHQLGHMRTNKNCPKYGEDPEARADDLEKSSGRPHFSDQVEQSQQKNLTKKLITTNGTRASGSEVAEDDKLAPKAKILKVKCGAVDKLPDKPTPPTSQTSDPLAVSDAETGNKSVVKVNKIIFSNKMRSDDLLVETPRASIVIKPPVESDRDQARKKIIIRQPKEASQFDDNSQDGSFGFEYRKTKKITELSGLDKRLEHVGKHLFEESSRKKDPVGNHWWLEEQMNAERLQERNRRAGKMRMLEEQPVYEQLQRYEEVIRREREEEELLRANAKKKKKRKLERMDNYLNDFPSKRNDKRIPELDRTARRGAEPEYGKHASDSGQQTKRRRAGEVGLSNILESIVETLKARKEISYLFLKPVTRKEAPDYFDIISLPMDLSTIRDKARRMEYKNRDEFWHDVWLIRYNAHKYNDGRNPGIPPLADQLLELCGYLLDQYDAELREAEAGIE